MTSQHFAPVSTSIDELIALGFLAPDESLESLIEGRGLVGASQSLEPCRGTQVNLEGFSPVSVAEIAISGQMSVAGVPTVAEVDGDEDLDDDEVIDELEDLLDDDELETRLARPWQELAQVKRHGRISPPISARSSAIVDAALGFRLAVGLDDRARAASELAQLRSLVLEDLPSTLRSW